MARAQLNPVKLGYLTALLTATVFLHSAAADTVHSFGGNFNIPIPAEPNTGGAYMNPNAIIFVPITEPVKDVDITIKLSHSRVSELQIFLKSPAGSRIPLNYYDDYDVIMAKTGTEYDYTTFDDEAAASIADADAPFTV